MSNVTSYYTEEELAALQEFSIPKHIAIIMDGNRRWARGQSESTQTGHTRGADTLMNMVKASKELGVKVLTAYTFSTENWERPDSEVEILMNLLESYLHNETASMVENGVHLETIGELSRFPERVKKQVAATKEATANCHDITLVLALNYGGRDELVRATRLLIDDYAAGRLNKEQVNEELISSRLDSARWPDPELFIRTSGEMRISNFLLWQLSYTELYITETLWPDFSPKHLLAAIKEFQERERRLGR